MRRYYIPWDGIGLVAATAKTIVELPTGATVDLDIDELFIGFDYASTTPGSVKVQWGTFTTTGTGTAATPVPYGENRVTSLVSAAKVADTVEPTAFTQGTLGTATMRPSVFLPLPGGPHAWQAATEQELYVPVSTNYGLRLTSTVACNTSGWISWKE